MISVLLTIGALAVVGIIGPLFALISEKQPTYGSQLEEYIVSQNPRDIADVERLTNEYDRKTKEGYL
jgi:hypothetical protein